MSSVSNIQDIQDTLDDNNANKEITEPEEKHWQSKEKCLVNRTAVLLGNKLFSDIVFHMEMDGTEIPAHKLLLITGSSVFQTMINGDWKEEHNILITDISSTAFKEILRYMYTDTPNLTEDIAFEVMYGAHKYNMPFLEEIVSLFLIETLNFENVSKLYGSCYVYKNKLVEECEHMIKTNIQNVANTDAFKNVNVKVLKKILEFNHLAANEFDLFRIALAWAELACGKVELPPTVANKRKLLEEAEKLIRFPTISLEDFEKCTQLEPDFFTENEIEQIKQSIENTLTDRIEYSCVKRFYSSCLKDCHIINKRTITYKRFGDKPQYFQFKVNTEVLLYGIGIVGSQSGSVSMVTISEMDNQLDLNINKEIYCVGSKKPIRIMFDSPIKCKENIWFTIVYNNFFEFDTNFYHYTNCSGNILELENGVTIESRQYETHQMCNRVAYLVVLY